MTLPGRALGSVVVDAERLATQAGIVDRGGGVGRIEWRVNGVTVGVDEPGSGSISPLRLSRTLQLDSGTNDGEMIAYNGANRIA